MSFLSMDGSLPLILERDLMIEMLDIVLGLREGNKVLGATLDQTKGVFECTKANN